MLKSRLAWATVGLVGTGVLLSPLAMAATSAPVAAEDLTLVEENGAAVTAVASADPQPLSRHHGGCSPWAFTPGSPRRPPGSSTGP